MKKKKENKKIKEKKSHKYLESHKVKNEILKYLFLNRNKEEKITKKDIAIGVRFCTEKQYEKQTFSILTSIKKHCDGLVKQGWIEDRGKYGVKLVKHWDKVVLDYFLSKEKKVIKDQGATFVKLSEKENQEILNNINQFEFDYLIKLFPFPLQTVLFDSFMVNNQQHIYNLFKIIEKEINKQPPKISAFLKMFFHSTLGNLGDKDNVFEILSKPEKYGGKEMFCVTIKNKKDGEPLLLQQEIGKIKKKSNPIKKKLPKKRTTKSLKITPIL